VCCDYRSVLKCVRVCVRALWFSLTTLVLQHIAARCSVLQCVVVCCYLDVCVCTRLFSIATRTVTNPILPKLARLHTHTRTHRDCNPLQRAATHCNALQHTVMRCNTRHDDGDYFSALIFDCMEKAIKLTVPCSMFNFLAELSILKPHINTHKHT